MVEEKLREFGNLSEAEVAVAMTLLDLRADQFARQQGLLPNEATRDAWYATRIGGVLTEEGAGKVSLEQKLTGMNDIQRRDFLFNMESVSVDTTSLGTERASIVQGAKEAYARISNTTVTNIHDGREIKFRKRGINKILGHIAHNLYDAKVVVSLPEIVRKGILLFSTRSEDVNDRALYYHYGTKTNIDGEEAFVRVIVREQSGNLFYDSHVTLMGEIEKTSSRASSATLTAADSRESLSKNILLNWLVKVKQSEEGSGEISSLFQRAKGEYTMLEDGRAVIRAFNAADISTLVHEIGHIFRRELDDADLGVVAKLGNLRNAAEFKDLEAKFWSKTATEEETARYRNAEEMFARGWERYIAEGDAPTPALRSLFKRFTQWMLNIYKELRKAAGKVLGFEKTELNVDIRAEVNGVSLRDIFDRLLVEEPFRVDYNRLLRERMQRIRETGRNWRLDEAGITR